METLEDLKAIIAGAPEGASHYVVDQYDFTECYFKLENCIAYCYYGDDGWKYIEGVAIELNGTHEFRSLSDIERIIELMEVVEDAAALGFLTPSFDSGVSHKQLCKKYEALK